MRYKILGPSGLRVSELCLGTMSFGETWGFGADEKESHRILDAFAEAGGNFIDTANKYHEGRSEEILGSYLGTERDRWVIGTKYSLAMGTGDPNAAGNARKNLRTSVEASLRRLRIEHLDLLWVHAWDFTTPVEEVMRALDHLVSSGTVDHVALSDAPAWVASQANTIAGHRGWSPFTALQVEYSLLERSAERELLPAATAFGLAVTAWAPLATGILTGKYSRETSGPMDSLRSAGNADRLTPRALSIARAVDRVADELDVTSAQVATAWLRQQPGTVIPVVGVRTLEQMEDLLGSVDVRVPPDQMSILEAASVIEYGFPHDLLARSETTLYGDMAARIDLPEEVPARRLARARSTPS